MLAGKNQTFNQGFKAKPGLICDFCGYKGHLKENCYKIIGYPPDFKSKKKAPIQGVKPYANAATTEKGNASSTQSTNGNFLTEDQYKQLLNLLNKQDTGDCHSLMAGINALLSNAFDYEWILDSRASHHITFHKEIMHDVKDCNAHNDSGVQGLYNEKRRLMPTAAMVTKNANNLVLWYMRLGHPSTNAIQHIQQSEVIVILKNFFSMVKNQFGVTVKTLRSDNGTEFFNSNCNELFSSLGIVHQSTCPYTPQQNGVIGKKHRHILEVARAMKFQSSIPNRFWGECVKTVVYLLNKWPTSILKGRSPHELLYNKPLDINHLRVFGCLCYTRNLSRGDKFSPRANRCMLVGN
ncbi:uncharacterized protein LOC142162856 [Nicotiana tabacum]|uniref:Uncharacterized protein LOC142162856 n=1 Tax=Nicotiana tabacum TaxID=4097 RepID=A0AC58RTA0_TOBAC